MDLTKLNVSINLLNKVIILLGHITKLVVKWFMFDHSYIFSPLPPISTRDTPVDCILTKYVRAAMNKVKCPVYTLVVSFF